MDRLSKFRQECERYAVLRRIILIILLVGWAAFTAYTDAENTIRQLQALIAEKQPGRNYPCPPSRGGSESREGALNVERLSIAERVC